MLTRPGVPQTRPRPAFIGIIKADSVNNCHEQVISLVFFTLLL